MVWGAAESPHTGTRSFSSFYVGDVCHTADHLRYIMTKLHFLSFLVSQKRKRNQRICLHSLKCQDKLGGLHAGAQSSRQLLFYERNVRGGLFFSLLFSSFARRDGDPHLPGRLDHLLRACGLAPENAHGQVTGGTIFLLKGWEACCTRPLAAQLWECSGGSACALELMTNSQGLLPREEG